MRLILFLTAVAVLIASQNPEIVPAYLLAGHPIEVPLMVIAGASLFSGGDSNILSAFRSVYKGDDAPPPDEESGEPEPPAQPELSEPEADEPALATEPVETAGEKAKNWTVPWPSRGGDTLNLRKEAEAIFADADVKDEAIAADADVNDEESAKRQPQPPLNVPAGPPQRQPEPSEIPVQSLAGGLLGMLGYRGPNPRKIPVEELLAGVVNVLGGRPAEPRDIPVETIEQGLFNILGKGLAAVVDVSKAVGSSVMSELRGGVKTIVSATSANYITAELRGGVRTLVSGTAEVFATLHKFVMGPRAKDE